MKPSDLRRWRERLGLTQTDVMRLAGADSPAAFRAWQAWETGARPVPWYIHAVMEYVERRA